MLVICHVLYFSACVFFGNEFQIFQIKGLMRTDKYSRFRRSDLYKDAVLAELEGKPFPFSGEPACEDPKDKQVSLEKISFKISISIEA